MIKRNKVPKSNFKKIFRSKSHSKVQSTENSTTITPKKENIDMFNNIHKIIEEKMARKSTPISSAKKQQKVKD